MPKVKHPNATNSAVEETVNTIDSTYNSIHPTNKKRKSIVDTGKASTATTIVTTSNTKSTKNKSPSSSSSGNPPTSVAEFRARLIANKAELYKDPPTLPFSNEHVLSTSDQSFPHRLENGDLIFSDHKDFRPNVSPEEILRQGSFGGTYFRSITSSVTNLSYQTKDVLSNTVDSSWITGLSSKMISSKTYDATINRFRVKCGGSLGMWESSGWMSNLDPYGWFQWYCRFYQGRRSTDDKRQIDRWLKSAGPKGRFRSQLCNMVIAKNTTADDATVSPVIRQTLFHWGFDLTEEKVKEHKKRTRR